MKIRECVCFPLDGGIVVILDQSYSFLKLLVIISAYWFEMWTTPENNSKLLKIKQNLNIINDGFIFDI